MSDNEISTNDGTTGENSPADTLVPVDGYGDDTRPPAIDNEPRLGRPTWYGRFYTSLSLRSGNYGLDEQ